jgi:drug/metabolite transporter (DMT)-like permease
LTLATLILTPIVLGRSQGMGSRSELISLTADEWRHVLLSGLLLAIHFVTWITSLSLTSVAASVVLMTTHPIFAALGSYLLLGERLERRMVVALGVALLGSGIIALGDFRTGMETRPTGSRPLLGDLLALIGGVSAAGYFVIGRGLRTGRGDAPKLSLLGYVYPVYGTAAVILLVALLISRLPWLPRQPETWLWLGLMALGPQILGHSSLNWALRYLSATFVTLATLAEPIGSTLLAWWLLGERPTVWTAVGGSLILGGIVVASGTARGSSDAGRRG